MTGAAFAAAPSATSTTETSPSQAKYECPDELNLNNVDGHGANNTNGYQSTCDEDDFGGNGQEDGPGKQTGKPCAGCVGNADDKNPPGQYPDGSDSNSGYECDGRDRPSDNQQGNGNHGIGDENPAHTGCDSTTTTEECPDGSAMPAGGTQDSCPKPPVFCPGTTTVMADTNTDGQLTADDCKVDEEPVLCPESDIEMTDVNGDEIVNEDDCTPETPVYCPGTDTVMTDVDGNGQLTPADCNPKVDEEKPVLCPDTDTVMTDVDGNGQLTPADCKVDEEEPVDTTPEPEIVITEVSPVTITPVVEVPEVPAVVAPAVVVPAAPAVAAIAALDVQPERVAATPASNRPTQVLGVQVERADLARTGLDTGVLVLLAGALLFVGALLVRTGRVTAKR